MVLLFLNQLIIILISQFYFYIAIHKTHKNKCSLDSSVFKNINGFWDLKVWEPPA